MKRLFLVLVMLVAMMGTASAQSTQPAEARVAGALFTPSRTDSGLAWRATWVLTIESAREIAAGTPRLVRFAVPLGEGEALEPMSGVVPFVESGRVAGIVVDSAGLEGRSASAVVQQRTSLDGHVRYAAPIATGNALQIVDGDLGAGTRLEVDPSRFLEKGVGHVAPPGTSHAAREEARRLTGYGARVTGAAVYVRGDDVRAQGGLTGAAITPRARGHRGSIAAGVGFAALVLALVFAVRKLRHAAAVERADALLASELDALEGGPR